MLDPVPAPRQYKGVMISSTFTDLKQHRAALVGAIKGQSLTDVAMENDTAKPDVDVIDSSLTMVRHSSAYIGVISHKYGQTPVCPTRNPGSVSLTELEFNEAQRLNRPILLFVMGEDHPVIKADVETDPTKIKKLEAFTERAKKMTRDSAVHRVYATFDSLEEFTKKAIHAIANLRRYLDEQTSFIKLEPGTEPDTIPTPPAFYAEPPYIGSHAFLGRHIELQRLNSWASPADPHPVILFDAIGGTGKSLLTWEWTTKHATEVRDNWAGRFWYSFYEKGAIMSDFCRRALSYITGQPVDTFRIQKTNDLGKMLVRHLQKSPWLIVLDGFERVLVAYHRFDAAQVADENAGASDQIVNRDPRAAIRPEDDDLLRALAAASPSKLIISSRLVPRALINSAGQPIPGVFRVPLRGLRPADAEALIRACAVTGDSQAIQNYLTCHCDCHPLVTGVLAGLINDYLPDRGNFDAWVGDSDYGGRLNLANLDLIQKRNHILNAALEALPEKSRQLLSTLALVSEAVDYPTLRALNPHRTDHFVRYGDSMADRWPQILFTAEQQLAATVRDLEMRGLLQYDAQSKRHDLHPVVRGVAAGGLQPREREFYGQRVVDHFSQQAHNPYEQAETLADVRDGLHVVRTQLHMGRYKEACKSYWGDLSRAIQYNLEAHVEILSFMRPFFSANWELLPRNLDYSERFFLANHAAGALAECGEVEEALKIYGSAMMSQIQQGDWNNVRMLLNNISLARSDRNSLAKQDRYTRLALDIATYLKNEKDIFLARLSRFNYVATVGDKDEAEMRWRSLDVMGRNWPRSHYLPGSAESLYAWFCFDEGRLSEEQLSYAEKLAQSGRNRHVVRSLYGLRGAWNIQAGLWAAAAESLSEAVRMARAVGRTDPFSETRLALAKFHLGQLPNPRHEAEHLVSAATKDHQALAALWLAIGEPVEAERHALLAYNFAWADGEPYVARYALNRARDLLSKLGTEVPNLFPYNASSDRRLPWEDELIRAVEKLRPQKPIRKRRR
jgi:uncharacterized protein DUF4062